MEAKVKITMEGETLRDLKIFLGDEETEITTMVTRAEIVIDVQNNRPIINLTLLPREIELPEHIIAQMQVERIHLLKPSERFARWRASRGKAIRGVWRRFVDRLPRKAPAIRITKPSAFIAPTAAPADAGGIFLEPTGSHETNPFSRELRKDDGYGQPGESVEARADESVRELIEGLPDHELDIIGPVLSDKELQAGSVLAEYGETYEEAARRQELDYTGPMTDTPTKASLEVQAEREQRSAQAIAYERELDIIKEQYDQAGKNILGAVAVEVKGQLRRFFGNKK